MNRSAFRAVLFGIGAALAGGGVLLRLAGCPRGTAGMIGAGAVLIVALLVERWRYKSLSGARPGPEWIVTDERFVDPETGKLVTVYFNPATGERRYFSAGGAGG